MWIEEVDGSIICDDCSHRFPPNLNVCPNYSCLSFKCNGAAGITSAAIGGVPSTRYTCDKCGNKYSSNNCLRLPYVWYFQKLEEMKIEVSQKM